MTQFLFKGETIDLKEDSPAYSKPNKNRDLESVPVEQKKSWWRVILERDLLMILIIVAVVLGFGIGIGINKSVQNMKEPSRTTTLVVLGFPGEILMRMLKMLILPLIISSLIVGLAALDQQASGRLGGRAIAYYMGTTVLAVILGIVLVVIIKPGDKASLNVEKKEQKDVIALDSFLDLLRYVCSIFSSDMVHLYDILFPSMLPSWIYTKFLPGYPRFLCEF